jgi:hypothetical protein
VRTLEWQFDYPARYEILALERIDRSGGKQAYSYPAGGQVDPSQELADKPILEVRPASGDPWVGVFYGAQYRYPAAARGRLLGWPDEVSLCVVWAGGADVVRSDDPRATYEIEGVHPITDVLSVPDHRLVVFADFTNAVAYGAGGRLWTSPRLAVDELALVRAEGGVLYASGFNGGPRDEPITVDLKTGQPLSGGWGYN